MEAACRHLKEDAAEADSVPFCLVLQQTDSVGGTSTLWHIAASLASSLHATNRAGRRLVCLTFIDPEHFARQWFQSHHQHLATFARVQLTPGAPSFLDQAQLALRNARASGDDRGYLFVDSLSLSLIHFPLADVLAALAALRSDGSVAGVAGLMCVSLHDRRDLDAVRSLASCHVLLRPVSALQADVVAANSGRRPHVEAIASTLRHSGRVKVDSALYEMAADSKLEVIKAPPKGGPLSAQQLARIDIARAQQQPDASPAAGAEHQTLQARYCRDAATGFMKLSLSEKEKVAREQVVLPFEHRGEKGVYAADDFRQYLPAAAGGEGKGGGKDGLGHIHYVRDSDNDYDSDEDPDDDLDI